jgi:hypothetical protein
MVTVAALVAVCLQLLPVALWMWMRSRRDRALWELALDIPTAVAVDILGVLVLARFMRLEPAVLVARALWLAVAVAWGVRNRRALPQRPRCLDLRTAATAAAAAACAAKLSVVLSRACHNYDRGWHMPLVASLRGQRIPFMNVYQPAQGLEYHYTGDLLASSLQTLSFGVIHASHALSLAHDLLFALTAVTAALLLRHLGMRGIFAVLVALAILTAGPLTLFTPEIGRDWAGYNFINFYKLSFRPHYPLSALLIIGFVGAVLVRLHERDRPPPMHRTALVLVACTALQTLTDEASIGLLGAGLGATWLVLPACLHERRLPGALLLLGMLAAVLVPHLLFAGTIAPGAVANHVHLVPWRSPGYYNKVLPLSTEAGRERLLHDLLPMAAVAAAGVLSLLRSRGRAHIGTVLFFVALLGIAVVALCKIEVVGDVPVAPGGGWAGQNHRFATAPMLAAPFVAGWLMALFRPAVRSWVGAHAVAGALMVGALGLGSASTWHWTSTTSAKRCFSPKSFDSKHDFYELDCRAETAAGVGEIARPTYAAKSLAYVWAGCHPSFVSGRNKKLAYRLKVGGMAYDKKALGELPKFLDDKRRRLVIVCPPGDVQTDPACALAIRSGECQPSGRLAMRCELRDEAARAALRDALKADSARATLPAPEDPPAPEEEEAEGEDAP